MKGIQNKLIEYLTLEVLSTEGVIRLVIIILAILILVIWHLGGNYLKNQRKALNDREIERFGIFGFRRKGSK